MSYVVGQPISDGFTATAAGQTWTRVASFVDGAAVTFAPTFADYGDGLYSVTYTPTVVGQHVWLGTGSGGDSLSLVWDVLAVQPGSGAGRVTVVSPVAQDGTLLRLVRGDDYLTVDGRALEWTTTDAATWPTLTGAAVALHLEGAAAAMAGTVVTPTGSAKKVRVELTDTMTAGFTLQRPLFQVVATLANADVVTLVAGRAQIAERITP